MTRFLQTQKRKGRAIRVRQVSEERPRVGGGKIKYYFPIKRYYLSLDGARRISERSRRADFRAYLSLPFPSLCPFPRFSDRTDGGKRAKGKSGNRGTGTERERSRVESVDEEKTPLFGFSSFSFGEFSIKFRGTGNIFRPSHAR